ncbi:hypothetical protein HD554DRAFT_2167481 [Boletus coccyginus]|nr:hypothetical protein HD554DRAFT_2167481 [Boletus coccyginus]
MNSSTFAFTPSKYWVVPIAIAPLVLWRVMPNILSPSLARNLRGFLPGWRSKGEEEREKERVRKLEGAVKGTTEENRKLREQVEQLRAEHQRAVDDSTTFAQSLKRDEKGKALSQNQRLTAELDGVRRQLDSKNAELKNLQNELQHSQTKHDELTTLLEARTRELKGAQVYLTKADTLSGAEVIALIDALNVEILQTSAFISDSFDFARQATHADEMKDASTRITELMGSSLTNLPQHRIA